MDDTSLKIILSKKNIKWYKPFRCKNFEGFFYKLH
jgi:hypothetical protein